MLKTISKYGLSIIKENGCNIITNYKKSENEIYFAIEIDSNCCFSIDEKLEKSIEQMYDILETLNYFNIDEKKYNLKNDIDILEIFSQNGDNVEKYCVDSKYIACCKDVILAI